MYTSLHRPPLMLTGVLLACCLSTAVSTPAPKTVLDYYLLLPEKYLKALGSSQDRLSLISLRDVKNGYLELSGGWEGDAHVVLWKSAAGQDLLGVSQTDCGPVCQQTLWFLTFKDGKWTNVTAKAFPTLSQKTMLNYYNEMKSTVDQAFTTADELPFLYILPRYQTTIKLIINPTFASRPTTLTTFKFDQKALKFVDTLGAQP